MKLPVISFLASHGGSSAKFLLNAMQDGTLAAQPGIVVTNNRDSPIFHWCLEHGVPVRHISSKTHRGAELADEAIASVLQQADTDLLVCSGYMKVIGPQLLLHFAGRILNIHPALLPRHGGKGMYGDRVHAAVLAATVHLVEAGVDEGPVLQQVRVPVLPDDTVDSLRQRVQAVEPALYLEAVQGLLQRWPAADKL